MGKLEEIDGKTLAMGALASLVGYVFYGFIQLKADFHSSEVEQKQVVSEQKDLWGKYNEGLKEQVLFMKEYYEDKLSSEKEWKEYYKSKIKEQ